MKRKLFSSYPPRGFLKGFLLLAIALVVGAGNANAQTDLAAQYLNNPDFASADGWTAVTSSGYRDYGVGKIGTLQLRTEYPAATVDATHLATENCAFLECRWSSNFASYTQESKAALPAGTYVLSYDVENTNPSTQSAGYENRFYVQIGGKTYTDGSTEWMRGKSSWTKHSIVFIVSETSKFTVSLGYGTGSNNFGVGATPGVFVSHLQLTKLKDATFPIDMTGFLTNADFGTNDATGWTIEKKGTVWDNAQICPSRARSYEYWASSAAGGGFDFYQTITGLPAGKYTITASMWNSENGENAGGAVNGNVGVYATSGTNSVFKGITTESNNNSLVTETTDEIAVSDGTLRIGVKNNGTMGGRWFGVDWIKLSLVGPPDLSSLVAAYNTALSNAKSVAAANQKMSTAASQALQTAISDYDTGKVSTDDQEELDAATTALNTAKSNAEASVANYAEALQILNAANSLDAAGKAAYASNPTISAIQQAYDNGSLTAVSNEQKTASNTALITAVKSQTTPGADMTQAINNWDFQNLAKDKFPGWTIDAANGNCQPFQNTSAEYWTWSTATGRFDYYQTINDLPAGKYTVQAHMWNSVDNEAGASVNGSTGVYGTSGSITVFKPITAESSGWNWSSLATETTDPIIVTDGTLRLGVKSNGTMGARWFGVDWVKLTFVGTDITPEEMDALIASVPEGNMNAVIAENLSQAKTDAESNASFANYIALDNAINAAKTSIDDYNKANNVLAKMKELVDATNVYTEEAYNQYYGTWLAKYEDNTLTSAEINALQDPSIVTGWHASITADNFLLSAWDTNPDFNNAPYYINTWSVEGDTDGTNFRVPFFEYWTGDDASLGQKVLTATINDLEPGSYAVSAWVRARIKNGAAAPATGITLQANDGEEVNVCDGAQTGQFFIKKVYAFGNVGQDGVLKIKFNVAAGNNVSWLTFKNVNYMKGAASIADFKSLASDEPALLNLNGTEAITEKDGITYVQDATSGLAIKGYTINGITDAKQQLNGQLFGSVSGDTIIVSESAFNEITVGDGAATIYTVNAEEAKDVNNVFRLVKIEMATIQDNENGLSARQGETAVGLSKRLDESLVFNDGDIVNSIIGVTLLDENESLLAPRQQDDIVPLLWNAENIEEGELKDEENPIDLTTSDVMARMENLVAGDVLKVQTLQGDDATAKVLAADGRVIFEIPAATEIEVPITADIVKEVNEHGLKIAVNGRKSQLVTVLNAKYTDTENTIWLGEGTIATLGAAHFEDVRKGDIITAQTGLVEIQPIEIGPNSRRRGTIGITLLAGETEITSGQPLTAEQAKALLDGTLTWTADGISKITFKLGSDPRNDKAEAGDGDSFAQSDKVATVDGMIMTFGGDDENGTKYEFAAVYPKVNKFAAMTEGIGKNPVDDNDKSYDPEQKNLPTKGTFYVFEPTKDGQLDITVELEKDKKLYVTEDGEALKDFNGITAVEGNKLSFPVTATKTYYVFANETSLGYYGFTFKPTTDVNKAKDIATFKLLPSNAAGDTLLLNDAVVNYIKGDHVYVEDASGAMDFYQLGVQFYVGQKLNGYIIGQNFEAEDHMPQMLRTNGTSYKTFNVTTTTPEPTVTGIANALKKETLASFVKFVDVRAKKDSKGFRIITDGTNIIRLEDHFNVFYEMPEVIGVIEGIAGCDKDSIFYIWPTSKEGVSEGIGLTEAEEKLLAEAKKLAEDREAVAVGLLDDEIVKAEAGNGKGLKAAIDKFNENNANNAKETYAKDKAAMKALIEEAEELVADETHQNDKELLADALEAGKAAQKSIRLNVAEFEAEIVKLRDAITAFKEANHMGGNILASGKYVLKNVASGLYWGAGNNWGTRASLLDYSEYQNLIQMPDGTYQMETQVSNGGTNYFFGGDYMDGQPVNLTITPIEIETEGEATEEPLTAAMFKRYASIDAAEGTATGCAFALNESTGLPYGDGNVYWLNYADLTNYDKLTVTVSAGTPRFCLNRIEDNAQDNDNPATTKFIDIPGHAWGTAAYQTKVDDNTYVLDLKKMREERGLVHLHSIKGAYWQNVTVTSMTLTKAAEAKKKVFYTVADGDKYFGNSTEEGYTKGTYILGKGLAADDENALWEIVPATTEALAAATEDEPMDATFLILNPNFGRNNRNGSVWTMQASNQNLSGGTNENKCAESWQSAFTLSQEIAVPNGIYALTAQAALTDYANLYDGADYPVVYANEVTMPFNNMEGSDRGSNMNTLSQSFANGNYKVGPLYVEVTDGKLTIGVKGTRTNTWCIWDNFQLQYYGADANIENISGGAEAKELEQLRQKATELQNDADIEIAAVKTGLTNALSETANVSGKDAIKAAIATLTAAIDKGEASKTAKNILPKMKELADNNNFVTEQAYNEYYGQWVVKYEDGSLTKAEAGALQDPTVVTGWHAQITVDNYLLSAWDTNPDFNNAPYYINSWSVEGDTDGSNFRVPFFEYWTGDDASLGERTLTGTVTGLEAGDYTVSAWVRVRTKNNTGSDTNAYGISMQANDGETVDASDGDTKIAVNQNNNFFLKEVTTTATVGADGTLTVKFNVAADNNISWLSFKNVKYTKIESAETESVIYAWESAEGTPVEKGGKIAYVNGDGDRLNYKNGDYYTICLNGKKANLNDEAASANAGHMVVTLDKPLQENDVIAITAYITKNSSAKSSAWIVFENGATAESPVYSDEANIHANFGGAITTTTVVVPAEAAGSKTITLTRGQTGTNLFITKLEITREAGAKDEELAKAPEGWKSVIVNGNLAGKENANFIAKEYPASDGTPAAITAGNGKDGSRGIVVNSKDKVSQAWDTQFWIMTSETLPAGTKVHVEFDYKADKAAKASTQLHGNPSNYMHWAAIGDVNFTAEWQHFTNDFEVATEANGMQSIAFNLNELAEANSYYFDNFIVWVQMPEPVTDWADIIVNGSMEGESAECFYVTEQGVGGPFLAQFTEGIGKDGGKAVKVQTADKPANDWASQFFVRLPYQLSAGTKFRFSFDYRASVAGQAETQAHNEPEQYIHYACAGSPNFTTEWQNYEYEGIVPSQCNGGDNSGGYKNDFQTIAFNLAKNKVATTFVFDNVKFEVEASVLANLVKDPAVNPTPYPVVGIETIAAEEAEGRYYDLQGRRVDNPTKGLFIKNGKKVVVK